MWIFTKYGFFSVTCKKDDTNTLQIRARVEKHLENLKERFASLSGYDIISNVGTDYLCRIYVPKEIWSSVMEELTKELDYNNFKNEVGSRMGAKDEYHQSLMDVWWTMLQLQPSRLP